MISPCSDRRSSRQPATSSRRIAVGQLGPSVRWTNFTVFDPDQPDEAFDELDRRRLESGGPADIIQIVQARCRSIRVGDPTLLRTVLDDSFVDGGHRPLGMGSRSVDDDVASITMLTEHGGRIYLPKIAAYTDGLHLIRLVLEYSGGFSDTWVVATRHDGRLTRTEDYAADDYPAAKARYDELVDPDKNP